MMRTGLADRVIGIVSICMFAMLSGRAFQISHRSPLIDLQAVFTSKHIDWIRPVPSPEEENWIILPLKHDARIRNYNESILSLKEYYAVNTIDDWRLQDKFLRQHLHALLPQDYSTIFMVMNRGKTIRMFENVHHRKQLVEDYKLSAETAFGCLVHYLFQPRPQIFHHVQEVFQPVLHAAKSIGHDGTGKEPILLIGIQIRTGDPTLARSAEHHINLDHYHAFFDCARQIEAFAMNSTKSSNNSSQTRYSSSKWFLVSDSIVLRQEAVKRFGADKILTSLQIPVEHSAKESSVCKDGSTGCTVSNAGFEAATAEWWLFSFTRYQVISQYSGYGRSAGMLSMHPNSIYTIPYKQMGRSVICNAASFTELGDMPYEWSGI